MRILFLVSTLERTGPNSQLLGIVRGLDRTRFEPVVATLSPERDASLLPEFERTGVPLRSLDLGPRTWLTQGPRRLRQLVRELRPDVLHSNHLRADVLATRVRGPVRVSTLRGILREHYPSLHGRWRGTAMARLQMSALRRLDGVVACSKTVTTDAAAHEKLRCETILNGVDTRRFAPHADPASLRARLGLPATGPIVVHSGPLIPRKRPALALAAFSRSRIASAGATLVFAGDGPLRSELEARARGQQVVFAGHVANVEEHLQAADVLLSTSSSEGLPNSVLEALASGLGLVLSDIGPHAEIIEEAPDVGHLVRGEDPAAFAEALDNLAGRDRTDVRLRARAAAERSFSSHAMAAAYAAYYERLVAARPAGAGRAAPSRASPGGARP